MERVLLIGAGMVGSQVLKLLVDKYHVRPVVIDLNFEWTYLDTIIERDSYIAVKGSILYQNLLEQVLREHCIRRVIHTAAVLPMRVGHDAHPGFYQVNTWGTANTLFACVSFKVERFLFFSTNGVYQFREHGVNGPVTEDYPTGLTLNNAYGSSKAIMEFLLRELTEKGVVDGKIIRPGEIYGPVPQCKGDMPIYWKQMLNAAIERREFVLDGHPEHRLDWVYSKDVASLACKLLICEETPNMEYNASYSKCIGIYDFISCLDKIFPSHKVKLKNCERGGWEYPLCMDRAKQDIDFMPQFNLESGITDYINWYLEAHKSGKNEDSRS